MARSIDYNDWLLDPFGNPYPTADGEDGEDITRDPTTGEIFDTPTTPPPTGGGGGDALPDDMGGGVDIPDERDRQRDDENREGGEQGVPDPGLPGTGSPAPDDLSDIIERITKARKMNLFDVGTPTPYDDQFMVDPGDATILGATLGADIGGAYRGADLGLLTPDQINRLSNAMRAERDDQIALAQQYGYPQVASDIASRPDNYAERLGQVRAGSMTFGDAVRQQGPWWLQLMGGM